MRLVMVCVRDAKADMFMRPFFANSVGMAIRSFTDEVNRNEQENIIANHPEDFSLYQTGLFDDQDGKVYPFDVPKLLIQADQVKTHALPSHISAV